MKRAQSHFFIPIFFCYFYATRRGDATSNKSFRVLGGPGSRGARGNYAEGAISDGGNGGICRQRY